MTSRCAACYAISSGSASSTTPISTPRRRTHRRQPGLSASGRAGAAKIDRAAEEQQLRPAAPLPLQGRPRLYVEGIDPQIAAAYGEVTAVIEQADCAILHLSTPFEKRTGFLREHSMRATSTSRARRKHASWHPGTLPTVVVIHLDRPAVIPEIAAKCAALLADFGASDAALLDVIFGALRPWASCRSNSPPRWRRCGRRNRICRRFGEAAVPVWTWADILSQRQRIRQSSTTSR